MAGATVLLNISASNETIGKSRYRTDLVVGQSGRAIAAYAMAGAGPSESTTDVVFGGHCLIAENGRLLAESPRVGDGQPVRRDSYMITQDVDVAKLQSDRRVMTSFDGASASSKPFRRVRILALRDHGRPEARCTGHSIRAREGPELHRRCAEIFGIQCAGLAKRIECLPAGSRLYIGISGGLDSTLAALVAVTTCDMLGLDRRQVHGLTMPGFGTTARTRTNALALMEHLGISCGNDRFERAGAPDFPGNGPSTLRNRLHGTRRRLVSCRAGSGSQRGLQRPGLRERPGPAAHVPADVQGFRRRHRRPLRAGTRLVDL